MTSPEAHALFLWVRDLGGASILIALIYQIGRLVKTIEMTNETMAGHITNDEKKFQEHATTLSDHGERIAHLEGAAPR